MKHRPAVVVLRLLGLGALTAVFVLWSVDQTDASLPSRLAALMSAALFAAVGLRFIPHWVDSWAHPLPAQPDAVPTDTRRTQGRIFAALLVLDVATLLMTFVLRHAAGYRESFVESLSFWRCLDSGSYLSIAENGYPLEGTEVVQLVFLPGYPLAVRLMMLLIPNTLYAGLTVSALAFAGAGSMLYRLARLDMGHEDALRAVRYLCMLPGAFFFVAPMSESLFVLLCILCIYLARTGRWALGGIMGGLAAFTRSLGITLLVPLLFELIAHRRELGPRRAVRQLLAMLPVPLGLGAYLAINAALWGNPLQFTIFQRTHWGQQLGWFFNTAAYQTREAMTCWQTDPEMMLGLWLPNLLSLFGSLLVMLLAIGSLRPGYIAWYIMYFLIAIGATWLLSAPRYMIAFVPLSLAFAALTRRERVQGVVEPCCLSMSVMYFYAFVMRWQVW